MWKHLNQLVSMGPCTIASASSKPVGAGWTRERVEACVKRGFTVVLREDTCPRRTLRQWGGIAYASAAKVLKLERAFGHANPYHRHAFAQDWWRELTRHADLAVIHYSYWAHLESECPKAVVLHDLLSDNMWGGWRDETEVLRRAGMVVCISKDEEARLRERGVERTLWSPPAIPAMALPDADGIALVGSSNLANREGLSWLMKTKPWPGIRVYGRLADFSGATGAVRVGHYEEMETPYRECGVILMTAALGTGVQIKGIEALAAGRAIVARRGAMRGLPPGAGAWIEVDTPDEMLGVAVQLQAEPTRRLALSQAARAYYHTHLRADMVMDALARAYRQLAGPA
jgi:hypothetical protein